MFYAFFSLGIEMPFTGNEIVYWMLEYARIQLNKTVPQWDNLLNMQCRFGYGTTNSKRKAVCAGKKGSGWPHISFSKIPCIFNFMPLSTINT